MICQSCSAGVLNSEARFCTKCGLALSAPKPAHLWLWIRSFGWLLGDVLTWPLRHRQERIRWLTEASGPETTIYAVPGLSDDAKGVYRYLADVTRRFGSSH